MRIRKNVRRFSFCIAMLVISISFASCVKKKQDTNVESNEVKEKEELSNTYIKTMPSQFKDGDEPIICVNKLNLEIIKDKTMNAGFTFHVLSKKPLDEKNVKVKIDVDTPYTLLYNETIEMKEKFLDAICLQYNKIDWKYLEKLEQSNVKEDMDKFTEMSNTIDTEYDKLSDDRFPSFYDNSFNVQFDTLNNTNKDESFDKVDFIVNDKTYTVNIGTVRFNYTEKEAEQSEYGKYDLAFSQLGRMKYNIKQNKEGLISLSDFSMKAKKDVKIKNIKLLNDSDSLTIKQVNFNIKSEDSTLNQKWKPGKDFQIQAGSDISVDFSIKDSKFMKEPAYSVNVYMVIEYEVDGKVYRTDTQALCESRYDSQMLYAMYKDHIDMTSYYNDYMKD